MIQLKDVSFGYGGVPEVLIEGICGLGLRNLTIVNNNAGTGHTGIARLLEEGCVGKIICSFPFARESVGWGDLLELIDPQVVALEPATAPTDSSSV